MPLPATVAHLDVDAVADVLINHHANIRNAARALNVPSGDLRKWVLLDERLSAAAVEAIELKLDVAEANLHEALGSEDPRRRDAVSMFFLRHMQRAAKRGYAVAALGVEANAEPARPVRYTIRWANEPVDDRAEPDDSDDTVVRDGKRLIMPKYGARESDSVDGAVVEPSVLLEHAVDTGVVESPAAVEPTVVEPEREPESAAVRYERERIAAWIRNRLIAWPLASCFGCRKPIVAGAAWEEVSNGDTNARARFHRTCHVEWCGGQEAAARRALGLDG
jgi:hypothetical protein